MKRVLVAGDFGKLHSGHLLHISKAYALGDWLYIVTHRDHEIIERKHYTPDCLEDRLFMLEVFLRGLGGMGEIIMAIDRDGTVADTIKFLSPNVFAKGGRYTLDTLPVSEVEACREIGCEIVLGVGETLNESRKIARERLHEEI